LFLSARAGLDHDPPSYASWVAIIIGTTISSFLVELVLINFLPGLALNHGLFILFLLDSWDYKSEPLCLALFHPLSNKNKEVSEVATVSYKAQMVVICI
jgi:hypothetical protein